MSDTKFTLLEVHLGDGTFRFGSKALGGGSGDGLAAGCGCDACGDDCPCPDCAACDCAECGDASALAGGCPCPMCRDGCDCVACKAGKALVVLAILAGVAALAWKYLGDGDLESAVKLDELAE